ncbi:hypothetical protein IO89_07885 [Epilithonimonas lactis]|uniref:Uncharacterized protein n=1 Tax=Epilithonimonas lactis TaxID=421072 RepID=A0A085BHE7_9FLAO|nr:hypothetical protein IO89_07885 [Epilithonimonas lactis]
MGCEILLKFRDIVKIKHKARKAFFELIKNIFKVRKDISLSKDLDFILNKKNEQLPVLINHKYFKS